MPVCRTPSFGSCDFNNHNASSSISPGVYCGGLEASGSSLTVDQVAAQVNLYASQTGVSASVSGTSLTFTSIDGRNTDIQETISGNTSDTGIDASQQGVVRGTITLSAAENITFGGTQSTAVLGSPAVITKDASTLDDVSNATSIRPTAP